MDPGVIRPLQLRDRVVDLIRGHVWCGSERRARLEPREQELLSWLARHKIELDPGDPYHWLQGVSRKARPTSSCRAQGLATPGEA